MKELFEVSKAYEENPKLKFPELTISSRSNWVHGLFSIYITFSISSLILGGYINIFTLYMTYIVAIIVFFYGLPCLVKSYKYKIFNRYYVIQMYYKRTSYKLGSISHGRSKKDVHQYTIEFTTLPQNSNTLYSIEEKIKSFRNEKAGFFFPTDDLEAAYRIIFNDKMYMSNYSIKLISMFSSTLIANSSFNKKMLKMKNVDKLLLTYLPNGDFLDISYQENETMKIIHIAKPVADTLEDKNFYTPLFTAVAIFIMPFLIYLQLENTETELDLYRWWWYKLTFGFSIASLLAFIYSVIYLSINKPKN